MSYLYSTLEYPPDYVVFTGKGTYDYKNHYGFGDNLIPARLVATPIGLFASDNWYGDVAGDDKVPEFIMGRIPVTSNDQLIDYVHKLEAYEWATGLWREHVMLLSDNPDAAGNFPEDSDEISQTYS